LKPTATKEYTQRLQQMQEGRRSHWVRYCNPYLWHIRFLIKRPTLEVGCGIGRILKFAPDLITGVDHIRFSVAACREKGLNAWEIDEFEQNHQEKFFSTLFVSHVLEHMSQLESFELLSSYTKYIRPGGQVIAITPQEKGYQSDPTHRNFVNFEQSREIYKKVGIKVCRQYSFPLLRSFGKFYVFNEFVTIGQLPEI
jgi:2-polyprenyl-3-methyl-5-hydroxy-6-metoxy-1,4-benzoquinol methylase